MTVTTSETLVEYCMRHTRGWMIAVGSIEILKNRIAEHVFRSVVRSVWAFTGHGGMNDGNEHWNGYFSASALASLREAIAAAILFASDSSLGASEICRPIGGCPVWTRHRGLNCRWH